MTEKELSELLTKEFKGKKYEGYSNDAISPWGVISYVKDMLKEKFGYLEMETSRDGHSAELLIVKRDIDGIGRKKGVVRIEVKRQKGEKHFGAFSDYNDWYAKEIKAVYLGKYEEDNFVDDLEQRVISVEASLDEDIKRREELFKKQFEVYKAIEAKCQELGLKVTDTIYDINSNRYTFERFAEKGEGSK